MANDKKIDCATVKEEGFAKDLAETFVECYKSMFNIELKVDEIERMARDILPDEFKICDIPEYLQKMSNLVNDVVSIPNEMVSALNGAIGTIMNDVKERADNIQQQVQDYVEDVKENAQEKLNEAKEAINSNTENAEQETPIESSENNATYSESEKDINELTDTLKIPAEAIRYAATGIILKRFQIIKYRCEIIQKSLLVLMAKTRKRVLSELLIGKDDAGSDVTTPLKSFLMGVAVVANTISMIIGVILNIINSVVILNVDAAGCAFGPTPKSFMATSKMTVANSKQSTTCSIPEPIDIAISEASNQYETAKGAIKQTQVLAMASNAASSVTGGSFNPGTFPALPKMDGTAIKQAIKLLLMSLVDAEALPRYEKLSPTNIRFLVFLITGFEPAAKNTFGLPGFP